MSSFRMQVGHEARPALTVRVAAIQAGDDGRRSSSSGYNGTNEERRNASTRSRVAPVQLASGPPLT